MITFFARKIIYSKPNLSKNAFKSYKSLLLGYKSLLADIIILCTVGNGIVMFINSQNAVSKKTVAEITKVCFQTTATTTQS